MATVAVLPLLSEVSIRRVIVVTGVWLSDVTGVSVGPIVLPLLNNSSDTRLVVVVPSVS